MASSETKRIILWTAPRCVSTAFERCMMNLKNLKALHEPYSLPYYFGSERTSTRYMSDPPVPNATYHAVGQLLQKEYDGVDYVFSKDMAYYVKGKFDVFLKEGFKNFQHTFLIRNPAKAVRSLYRASINPRLTGWNHFEPEEAGFIQMFELYNFVKAHLDRSPVILDADDLLKFPDEVVKSYCACVGADYEPGMTRWDPGPVAEWDVWSGWHEDVLKSSGFQTNGRAGCEKKEEATKEDEFPKEVHRAIEESMAGYQIMHANRIRIPVAESEKEVIAN